MSIAPQQDWAACAAWTADEEAAWIRALGTSDRFTIYADLFGVIWTARQNSGQGDWEKLDRWSWQQKLVIRLRCVEAYKRLDEFRKARATATNSG